MHFKRDLILFVRVFGVAFAAIIALQSLYSQLGSIITEDLGLPRRCPRHLLQSQSLGLNIFDLILHLELFSSPNKRQLPHKNNFLEYNINNSLLLAQILIRHVFVSHRIGVLLCVRLEIFATLQRREYFRLALVLAWSEGLQKLLVLVVHTDVFTDYVC